MKERAKMAGKPRDKTTIDAEFLATFSAKLAYLAGQFDAASKSIGDSSVSVIGAATADRGLSYVTGWLQTVRQAADEVAMAARIPLTAKEIAADGAIAAKKTKKSSEIEKIRDRPR
jgi:hypothetical protein